MNLTWKKKRTEIARRPDIKNDIKIIKYLSIFFINKFLEGNKEMAERG